MVGANPDQWPLRRGSLIYPSPVAVACGRVLRARTASERVNACLKASEVLSRYLAAVAIASFATREGSADAKLSELDGNLSFGHFLGIVQEVAGSQVEHPVKGLLAQGFKKKKRNKESVRGKSDAALVLCLELRNELGHELRNLDEAKAASIEATQSPMTWLIDALEGVEGLLAKPLFVVENQEWTRDALVARRLRLMGESADPTPESIKLEPDAGLGSTGTPYVAINKLCLPLPPCLLWGIDAQRQNFALLFLDAIDAGRTRYCTLDGNEQHREDGYADQIRSLLSGCVRQGDTVVLVDGRHLAREWSDLRARIEEGGRRHEGRIDWSQLDQPTLTWFAGLLDPESTDPHATLQDRLLDGRSHIEPDELRQLTLLFGRPAEVRSRLQRDVLDLRVIDPKTQRLADRRLVESENILEGLKLAVRFFADHMGMGAVAPEDLKETDGSLDYLTLREILLNQIIHQDYTDVTASGQIEIHAEKVTVFNTGCSLVPQEDLLVGGKSQSRNPLIARALRSIGFAEISGSGIRAVHRACQHARRRAPIFESDKANNTFTLTLDWSEGEPDLNAYWDGLVGVELTEQQAAVLDAIAESPGVTIPTLEANTGMDTEELVEVLDFLLFQVLVEEDESEYRLARHLKEKLG